MSESTPFDQIAQKLSNGEIITFSKDFENTLLNFVNRSGQIQQTVARFNHVTNKVFPPLDLVSFEDFSRLLESGLILGVKETLPKEPTFSGNTLLNFADSQGNIYRSEVQYDITTNRIFPPDNVIVQRTSTVERLNTPPNGCVKYIIGRANEDRFNIALLNGDIQMYAVYDGHAGDTVADYLRDNLPEKFATALLNIDFNDEDAMKQIITDVFIDIDTEMHQLHLTSGSTGNVALRKGNKLYISNVADSRAIIFNSNNLLFETLDHDGKNSDEVKRIRSLGGYVMNGRVEGRLAVTRAFGDFEYKRVSTSDDYNPRGWVSVVPDVYIFNANQPNLTLLIASDGLWEGKYEKSNTVMNMILTLPQGLDTICNSIAMEGRRNYGSYGQDDITVIIVRL